jgi:hypothetical protein
MKFNISIIGLIVGTFINMGLGALWYSNVLFAKSWMKEAGITDEDIQTGNMGQIYGLTALGALIASYVLGFLVLNLNITSILDGLLFAVILWLGTHLPMIIKNWGFENRSFKLGFINHGYDLVVYLLVISLYIILN